MDSSFPLFVLFALVLTVAISAAIGARLGKSKGNSAWGVCLGILGPLGWLITLVLPSRHRRNSYIPNHRLDTSISNVCKKCGSSNPLLATECAECGTPINKRNTR